MHTQPGFVSDGKNLTPEDVARIARTPRDISTGAAAAPSPCRRRPGGALSVARHR